MSHIIKNIPNHVAIIPDGNRRWARQKGLKPWIGHEKGAEDFEKVLEKALELKIPYITFWAGSFDNLTKRSKIETNFLFKVYTEYFKRITADKKTYSNSVKINVFGRWQEVLPRNAQEAVKKAVQATKSHKKHVLTFLVAYNGTDEMVDCIQKIVKSSRAKPLKVTERLIKQNLWTKDLPPVDLVIRTGSEQDPHNSTGFMMWDTAYSQFYFTKTLFPDFGPKEFEKIIKEYSQRQRRFGR